MEKNCDVVFATVVSNVVIFVWRYNLFVLLNGKILYYYNVIFFFKSNIATKKTSTQTHENSCFAFVVHNLCSGFTIIINNNTQKYMRL